MERIEKTVFISYRRTNASWALVIYKDLTQHGYDVFFDFTGIASGDFERVILENIKARAHFLVVLTPSALERCDEPGDWLCREIEAALELRRNIVPLMLEGFDFSTPSIAKHLTGRLAGLKNYNALNVPVEYFDAAMDRLRGQYLNIPLTAVPHSLANATKQDVKEQQTAANAAPKVSQKHLTAQEWFEQGYQSDNYDEQIRCYTEAIRLKPDYAYAYNGRGVARNARRDPNGAIRDYNEAIRLNPDFALAYYNRGRGRLGQGDLAGAIKDYTEAIRLKPDDAAAYVGRGVARSKRGDPNGAIKDYNEAIRLNPDFALAYFNRGHERLDQGDLHSAINDYNEAIRLNPDFALAYYNRGRGRLGQGDLAGAIKDYTEAIRLDPKNVEAYYNRGIARSAQHDPNGAVKDFTEAIRLDPRNVEAYYNRGIARKKLSDRVGALADFEHYRFMWYGLLDPMASGLSRSGSSIGIRKPVHSKVEVEVMIRDLKTIR